MQQLSLWDEPEPQPPAPTEKKWYTPDEIIVRRERWADTEYILRTRELLAQGLSLAEVGSILGYGEFVVRNWLKSDSLEPAGLERLALVLLGDLDCGFIGNDGSRHYYRCISTGIVDGQVLAAYQYERPARSKPLPPLEKDEVD